MAYDEGLAQRVREAFPAGVDVTEKKMFGGLCFLASGKMCCGVLRDEMMVRVGRENQDAALRAEHARPMDFTGRPMKGFVFVSAAGLRTEGEVEAWVRRGLDGRDKIQPCSAGNSSPRPHSSSGAARRQRPPS
jgi:TfoX/Sxy family transcriptional regulator of competence genes